MQIAHISDRRPLLQRRNSLTTALQAAYDGLAVVLLAFGLTLVLDVDFSMPYVAMILVLLGAMSFTYDRFSVYRQHGGMTQKAMTLGKAWGMSFAILLILGFLTKNTEFYSRLVVSLLFFLGYGLQLAGHIGLRHLQRFSAAHQHTTNALVIGTGPLADHLYTRINTNPWMQEHVVGTVTVPEEDTKEPRPDVAPNLGDLNKIMQLVDRHDIAVVYIAVSLDASPIIKNVYFQLLDASVDIHWAPNIFALSLINHSVKELAGIPILTLSESPLIGSHLLLKSVEDRGLATLLLILASPIMLLTAVAIKLESPGPVFFRQSRTGWDGKQFKIWKFRSMRLHQTMNGEVKQATRNDRRVTRVGRFIRSSSIDELPQLFNVLTGQMSLVGPRPHAIEHNQEYSKQISAYLTRHRIKPGITGLAQVRGCRGEITELEQMEKRVNFDLEYINSWSVWLDLSILARTVFHLTGKNAR